MRPITYSIIALFLLGIAFTAGNSFAQPMNPFGVSLTPSMIAFYRIIAPIGTGWSIRAGYSTPSASLPVTAVSTMVSGQLRTPQGDYLAEISDLVIDPVDGRISNIVLTGIRGMGAKAVIIPFDAVSKTGETIFIYNAPAGVSQFSSDTPYRRWGLDLFSEHQKPVGSYTARELIGAPVQTPEREDLGRIDNLVIDSKDGHIVQMVVHSRGTGGKMACLPFRVLSKSSKDVFVLKTMKEEFKTCS